MSAASLSSRSTRNLLRHGVLIFFALLSFYPIFVMCITALRPAAAVMQSPFGLPTELYLDNLTNAWVKGRFGSYFLNSMIITIPGVIGVVVLSALAGYGIARFRFRGRMYRAFGKSRHRAVGWQRL